MIQTIRNAWAVPELRKKILFTIMALLIFLLVKGMNRLPRSAKSPYPPPKRLRRACAPTAAAR